MSTERAKWYIRCIRLLTHKLLPLSFIGAVGFWLATKIQPISNGQVGPTGHKLRVGFGLNFSLFHRGTVEFSNPNLPFQMWLHVLPGWFIFQLHVVMPNVGTLLTSSDLSRVDRGHLAHDLIWLVIRQVSILLGLTLAISVLLWLGIALLRHGVSSLRHRSLELPYRPKFQPRVVRRSFGGIAFVITLIAAVMAGAIFTGIHRSALISPSFSGNLVAGGQMLDSEFLSPGANQPLDSVGDLPQVSPDEKNVVRVLHDSDFHVNPTGFALANQWARLLHANFILDTGDTASFGTPAEANLVLPKIRAMKLPYVYIRGNHDPRSFELALHQARNVIDLDHGRETTVDGITIMGWGDPVLSPYRPDTPREQECRASMMVPAIEKRLAQTATPPDILAVHDPVMVDGVLATRPAPIKHATYEGKQYLCVNHSQVPGTTPLIVAGHLHRQYTERLHSLPGQPDTLFLHDGTTGADGLGALRRGAHTPYSAELLTFARKDGRMQLIQYDVIARGHNGKKLDRNTTIDGYPVAEPFYQNQPPLGVPAATAATNH